MNVQDEDGGTALIFATKEGYTDMVKHLLDNGADTNVQTKNDGTALMWAARKGYIEIIKLLLENGVDQDEDGWTVLMAVAREGYVDIVKYLLDNGADVDAKYKDGSTALMNAIQDGHTETSELLITYGADVNVQDEDGVTALIVALVHDYTDIVKLLLQNGAHVNSKDKYGNTPLITSTFPFILEKGSTYNLKKNTNKKQLATNIIKSLIENGANINEKNNMGMTALMLASFHKNTNMVKLLLKYGADINMKSEMTAFDLADDKIKKMINDTRNHTPQKLVKNLANFTLDRPIKFTTHIWDFGDLKKEYKDFDGYMAEVRKQFNSFEAELKNLSENLYAKIKTFLLETNPKSDYSWCSKAPINIGWSSLDGLKEWCNNGKNPFDFTLSKPIFLDRRTKLTKFGEVIELFKQEIEIRRDFKNLTTVFERINDNLGNDFNLTTQKLERQFYTDVEKFTITLDKIFDGIKKHSAYKDIEVIANESEDGTIELRIIQVGSPSTLGAEKLLAEVEDGDFADIKANLTNLCDWSVEGSFKKSSFRINYLKSNNVKDITEPEDKPIGFTHILKFYKR